MTRSDITLDEYLSELRADAKEYNRRFLQTKEVETSGEVKQRGLCKRSFPRYYVDVPEKEKGEMCFGKVTDSFVTYVPSSCTSRQIRGIRQ